jgi:hypothetical protein
MTAETARHTRLTTYHTRDHHTYAVGHSNPRHEDKPVFSSSVA